MYTEENINQMNYLLNILRDKYMQNNIDTINTISPYSIEINKCIRSAKELDIYVNLNLKEDFITRKALIMTIDPEYKCTSGETNLERMLKGKPAYDVKTHQPIDLHHIGQKYLSPFAELPHFLHIGTENYSVLHETNLESWRLNRDLTSAYTKELALYWKQRGDSFI